MFEDETGIDVVYEEYETNEIMYPKVQSGAIAYDVVCPFVKWVIKKSSSDIVNASRNPEKIPGMISGRTTFLNA